jgi:flagellar protein FliL
MSAKTEAKEAPAPAAEKEKAAPAAEGEPAAEKAPAAGGKGPMMMALAAVVLAPALSWGVVQFVLLPRFVKKLGAPGAAAVAAAEAAVTGQAPAADAKSKTPETYSFSNVVVNLAGTMGTRYLKTSFIVTGPDAALPSLFDQNKAKLTDVTLNVLSALTLADLEEPGARNVLRERLVAAYNQALGHKVVDQVYFSDFVVQ